MRCAQSADLGRVAARANRTYPINGADHPSIVFNVAMARLSSGSLVAQPARGRVSQEAGVDSVAKD